MIKKQRVIKALSILSVSLGIVLVTLFSNTKEIKAATGTISTSEVKGSISTYLSADMIDLVNDSGVIEMVCTINFDHVSWGTATIYNYNAFGLTYSVLIENAYITSKSNTSLNIKWNNAQYIEIHYYLSWYDIQEWILDSISSVNNAVQAFNWLLDNWGTRFDYRSATWTSVYKDIDDDDIYDVLGDISSTLGTIDTDINGLVTYIDNIETYLSTSNSHLSNISSYINTLLTNIDKIDKYDIRPYQYPAYLLFDRINDITYSSTFNLPVYNVASRSTFTWSSYTSVYSNTPQYFVYMMKNASNTNFDYVLNSGNSPNYTRQKVNETSTYSLWCDILNNTGSSTEYYTPINSADYEIIPIYLGTAATMPDEVSSLLGMVGKDAQAIIDAINNITFTEDVTNVINNKDTVITNITNDRETVNNITNNFVNEFDSADNSITLDTNFNISDTVSFYTSKLNLIKSNLGQFQQPIYVGFILLIILTLIGR